MSKGTLLYEAIETYFISKRDLGTRRRILQAPQNGDGVEELRFHLSHVAAAVAPPPTLDRRLAISALGRRLCLLGRVAPAWPLGNALRPLLRCFFGLVDLARLFGLLPLHHLARHQDAVRSNSCCSYSSALACHITPHLTDWRDRLQEVWY